MKKSKKKNENWKKRFNNINWPVLVLSTFRYKRNNTHTYWGCSLILRATRLHGVLVGKLVKNKAM